MLIGMMFRMGLPLAALVTLPRIEGRLATSGISTTILGIYLVALIAETLLALRLIQPQTGAVTAT